MKFLSILFLLLIGCTNDSNVENESSNTHESIDYQENKSPVITPVIPNHIEFAGESYILKDRDLIERLDRELVINTHWHSNTLFYLKRSKQWFPLLSRILKDENIPNDFKYLAVIESGLSQATSPSGAKGFWQFMPETAKEYGLEVSKTVDERLHVEKSTRAACKYLKKSYKKLGSWELAAVAYNRGKRGIETALEDQEVTHLFDLLLNDETARYFFRILAVKEIMEHPHRYQFKLNNTSDYAPLSTVYKTITENINNLSSWAKREGFNLKIIKKLNPWLISNQLSVEKGKSYVILLPSETEKLKPYAEY